MVPSLPIDLPKGTRGMFVSVPLPCAMLRQEHPCGNDADLVLVCPAPGHREQLIPVCQMCSDEATDYIYRETGKTWLALLEEAMS